MLGDPLRGQLLRLGVSVPRGRPRGPLPSDDPCWQDVGPFGKRLSTRQWPGALGPGCPLQCSMVARRPGRRGVGSPLLLWLSPLCWGGSLGVTLGPGCLWLPPAGHLGRHGAAPGKGCRPSAVSILLLLAQVCPELDKVFKLITGSSKTSPVPGREVAQPPTFLAAEGQHTG